MKLSELYLNRYLYRDNNQDSETKDASFVASDSSDVEPDSIPSGGAAQDINSGNVEINGGQIEEGTLPKTVLDVSNYGWGQTAAFSSTDADTVSWGGGDFISADGTTYTITAGNTGNMVAKTYIYLDLNVPETEYQYQLTATPSEAVGVGKVLIAVAEDGTSSATYMLSEATQIVGDNILANSIDASKIVTGQLIVGTNVGLGSAFAASSAGDLATLDLIQTAQLGSTVIVGGYIKTSLLTANNIITGTLNASVVSVTNIDADNINTGTIDASSITVSNINASNIETGTLSAIDVQSGTGNERIILDNGNYIRYYSGGSLRASVRGTTLGSGGLFQTGGDYFIQNNRTYWIGDTTGGSTLYGGIGITNSNQLWLTCGTANTFFIKNNAQSSNYLTVSSTKTYINGYLLLDTFSSNPTTETGSIWHFSSGGTEQFRGEPSGGWNGSFDMTAV